MKPHALTAAERNRRGELIDRDIDGPPLMPDEQVELDVLEAKAATWSAACSADYMSLLAQAVGGVPFRS